MSQTKPPLDPLLLQAIADGHMTEEQARAVDAFADGVIARGRAGEITEEQASKLIVSTAIRDGLAERKRRARGKR